jgi:hypothetical protein
VYEVGVLAHVPVLAVRTWPKIALPEIAGAIEFVGREIAVATELGAVPDTLIIPP